MFLGKWKSAKACLSVVLCLTVPIVFFACSSGHAVEESPLPIRDESTLPLDESIPAEKPEAETTASVFDPIIAIATINLEGKGDDVVTVSITEPSAYRCLATHSGEGLFVIRYDDSLIDILAVNEIGQFSGAFALVSGKRNVSFEITADGNWTLQIEPIVTGGRPENSGKGMFVSNYFNLDGGKIIRFTHDGQKNFVVYLNTSYGRNLYVNEIGVYEGKMKVDIPLQENAFWEVMADGNWSISLAE